MSERIKHWPQWIWSKSVCQELLNFICDLRGSYTASNSMWIWSVFSYHCTTLANTFRLKNQRRSNTLIQSQSDSLSWFSRDVFVQSSNRGKLYWKVHALISLPFFWLDLYQQRNDESFLHGGSLWAHCTDHRDTQYIKLKKKKRKKRTYLPNTWQTTSVCCSKQVITSSKNDLQVLGDSSAQD